MLTLRCFNGFKFESCLREVKTFGLTIVAAAQKRRSNRGLPGAMSPTPLRVNLIDSFLDHIAEPAMVADAAVNFLSAGRDTTASSMSWLLFELARHPEDQERMREEITAARSRIGGGDFTSSDLDNMEWVNACIKVQHDYHFSRIIPDLTKRKVLDTIPLSRPLRELQRVMTCSPLRILSRPSQAR